MSVMEELMNRYLNQERELLRQLLNKQKLNFTQKQLLWSGIKSETQFRVVARAVLELSELDEESKMMKRDADLAYHEFQKIRDGRFK